ncbi:MAG: TauD/TfdA family dioxygenase [Ilumatobacteraceae bacterium]
MRDISFSLADRTLMVTIDGDTVPVPALWLREWTQDPSQLDLVSDQRTFDPHRLDPALEIVESTVDAGTISARFSDGHAETWDTDVLAAAIAPRDCCPDPIAWRADIGTPPRHDWRAIETDEAAMAEALHDFLAYGAIVVHDSPTTEGTVLDIASRFGFVRRTNFGVLFDVRSVPNSNDLAYRSIALGAHTDNPYREPVPGIQLLHCLVNETSGGLSTLVDAIAVTDRIRTIDPDALQLLIDVPVRYTFRDDHTMLDSHRPVVATDHRGAVTGLHYSPKLDHVPLMSVERTQAYQRARQLLSTLLADSEFEITFRLDAGEAMIFSNDRVLHGCTSYDTGEGHRHLQGCYIDHDEPSSRYRVLRRAGVGVRA